MDDFKNKVDALRIIKEEKIGTKLNVYFEYYETADNPLDGTMEIRLAKTRGVGKLFGNDNLSLQQIIGISPEITVKYTGDNKPKNSSTSSLIFDLYLRKRHPVISKIKEYRNANRKEKEKFKLDDDFYDDGNDSDDDEYDG